jgi:predicted metal-dependent hydrolase
MRQLDLFGRLLGLVRAPKAAPQPKIIRTVQRGPEIISVDLGGRQTDIYLYRKKGGRNFTLSLMRSGTAVRLTMPARSSLKAGIAFVHEKQAVLRGWLATDKPRLRLCPDAIIPFKGVDHKIIWQADLKRTVNCEDGHIYVGGPSEMLGARVARWLRAQALADLEATTRKIAADFNLPLSSVAVNNATARWGSCSSKGRINYAWRLICAPDAARYYVAAHELAHLKHMNHAPVFWAEVERLGGDLAQRDWFRVHGPAVLALA